MPAEKVSFKDRDITWVSPSEWADLYHGGRARVGVADIAEGTPLLHVGGRDGMDWFHVHGTVVLEEGQNPEGVPWVRVLYPTRGAVLTKVPDEPGRRKCDAYEEAAL